MKILLFSLIMSVLIQFPVMAGNPKPLFDKPVKLDESGRPMYNSWERYEYERQLRLQRKQQPQNVQQQSGKTDSNQAPTPSSTIINRPVELKDSIHILPQQ